MTDRQLLQQALNALEIAEADGNCYYEATELLRTRLAHCDRCGKRLGGEGDIHTCTPDPIGDAQDKLIAEMAAQPKQEPVAIDWDTKTDTPIMGYTTPPAAPVQPEQEPVACLSKTQATAILGLALDLEKTGRMVVITQGQERTDFVARNRNIQCALEDALRNATTQPAAPVQEPVSCKLCTHKQHYLEMTGPCNGCRFYSNFAWDTLPAAQRKPWVALTKGDIAGFALQHGDSINFESDFAYAIERYLRGKNT